MTTPPPDPREALAEVLSAHPGSERGARGAWCVKCLCGHDTPVSPYPGDAWDLHRAHVADHLARLLATREAEALERARVSVREVADLGTAAVDDRLRNL